MNRYARLLVPLLLVALAGCGSGDGATPRTEKSTIEPTSASPATVPSSPTEDPLAEPAPLWPQTSLEEVRRAQELADARDPDYMWQVAGDLAEYQLGQHHPGDAQIFPRFLEQKLGWEGFRWDEAFAHPDGLDDGEVVYVRCAPSETNPQYPTDSEDPGCAPTIDDLRYETVKIQVAQPARQGYFGIWVVTGWEMIEPAEQIAPPSDAEIDALLGGFLRARIAGEGAEEFDVAVDDPSDPSDTDRVSHEIPLLYATSTGVPYQRSEFELVDGPVWPLGSEQFEVRLFAENGTTVVKQVFSMEGDETGRLRLGFDLRGRTGPTTTENGKTVPLEYRFLGGEVTYRAVHPAILTFLTDPRTVGPGCQVAPAPTDAEALARSIRSDPDLEATAPVGVTIGGIPALQMDVVLAPAATFCPTPRLLKNAPLVARKGTWARLYLLDLPGRSNGVLAIAIFASEEDSEAALEAAAPIVDSIEFHTRPQGGNNGAT